MFEIPGEVLEVLPVRVSARIESIHVITPTREGEGKGVEEYGVGKPPCCI